MEAEKKNNSKVSEATRKSRKTLEDGHTKKNHRFFKQTASKAKK